MTGNELAETEKLAGAGAVLVDPAHPLARRELVVTTGADRIRFLQGIVTANVAGLPVGGGGRALLLTPKGHIVADLRLFVREDAVWIVVDAGQAATVASALGRYAIMDDFSAAAIEEKRLLPVLGPDAGRRLAEIGLDVTKLVDRPPYTHTDASLGGTPVWVARMNELGAPGFWIVGDAPTLRRIGEQLLGLGTTELPAPAVERQRISALEPLFGAEITPDYFPMEVGLTGAIDYGKGCFLGQEPIVRIRDRGHTNWRLVRLDVIGSQAAAVSAGDPLESDSKPKAGHVTSVAVRQDGAGGVALAMLHVSIPLGAAVRVRHGDTACAAQVGAEA